MTHTKQNHLFYQTRKALPFVERAQGIYLWDHTGKEYIDGCSGAIICNIGYGNPRIEEAITAQARCTFFAYRLHFESRSAVDLAAKLVEHSAPHLNRVFYVSGGSEAVESAMKLCRQYYCAKGQGSRHLFISREPSYHGCTMGALALTAYSPLEIPFRPMFQAYPKIPAPNCYRCAFAATYPDCDLACARDLERVVKEQGPENVAAFIAEPVGGASTGGVVPPEGYFAVIQEICQKYGMMLILDEVMTGFGRTGKLFAYEHWGIQADIVALSKGMASGYYPLGAIMARSDTVEAVLVSGGFAHGHTYAGNPMACAVGLEVLSIILEENLAENAARVGKHLKAGLQHLAQKHPMIGDVRGKGLLLGLELVAQPETRTPFPVSANAAQLLTDEAYEQGLIIYPRRSIKGLEGDHVLVAPPLIISKAQSDTLIERLDRALTRTKEKLGQNRPAPAPVAAKAGL
jgi:adenosylmethionine-8-amino-7-oxononanoate aminotransferase